MNQLLQTKSRTALFQDLIQPNYKFSLKTQATEASCYVCGKGLENGYIITAKKTVSGNLLFCEKHNSMN